VELGYDEAGLTEGLELKSQVGIGDAIADVQAAVDAVKDAGKVAVVGYCWGGYLAYLSGDKVGPGAILNCSGTTAIYRDRPSHLPPCIQAQSQVF
jgi:carboxymethylenebutenolidase